MKKDKIILSVIVLIVVLIILGINYFNNDISADEETMQCIADNSILIVSRTCGHCADQLKILGSHKDKFELLYVDDNPALFELYDLIGVPTWIIGNKKYSGVQSISKLKRVTEC